MVVPLVFVNLNLIQRCAKHQMFVNLLEPSFLELLSRKQIRYEMELSDWRLCILDDRINSLGLYKAGAFFKSILTNMNIKGTGSRFSAFSFIKMLFFCWDMLHRLCKQYDHVIMLSKNQSAHSPGSQLINSCALK